MHHLLILGAILVALPFCAYGQDATVVGTVTDPSGSSVANAKITITNLETKLSREVNTSDSGQYAIPEVHPGKYDVKAEASGFKVAEQKGVVLQVGDRARLDFQMILGGSTETVTVEANAVRVQSDSGEVSNVITDQQVSQIAVNGRSIYQLAALTPGASSQINNYVNTPVGGCANVAFNGLRQNHNIYLLDGGEDDDRGGAGGMSIAPSSDAIAEFRALTSNYSADYGLSSAATMTMVLKSGTSTLHASAWEFDRNDAFDAHNFFRPGGADKLRLNVFGFNVGGPVTLGKLYNPGRKKTFFFYNMEWRRLIQAGTTNQNVPDPHLYTGDFSSVSTPILVPSASQVNGSVLFRNCTGGIAPVGIVQGSPFPGNKIPSCMIDNNASVLANAGIFPAPTTTASNGIGQFRGGANTPTNLKEEVVRIDHNFNSKFSVFGHFIAEQVSQGFSTSQWSGDNVPTVGDTFGNPSYSGVVHATYAISPTVLNEVAFNYNGNRINIIPFAAGGLKSLALPTGYDSTNSRLFTGPNNLNRIPNIDLTLGTGAKFEIASWPWRNKADDYQIRDDVSWTHGAHQFKIGGSWAIYKKVQDLFGTTQGAYNFDGTFTGNDIADFMLGTAKGYTELAVQDSGKWNNVSWAAYAQDNWRATRRLTLNLGLRWDGVPHTYEANNRMGNFYPNLYNPADAATFNTSGTICGPTDNFASGCPGGQSPGLQTSPNSILKNAGVLLYQNGIGIPGQNGIPKGLVDNHWAAFGPRLGFAYDLLGDGKTVIRGGFGLMYERIQGNDMYDAGPNIPFSLNVNTPGPVEMENPNIALATGSAATFPINPAAITGLDRANYKLPLSSQWSAGVQRALSAKTVLSVTYVGNTNRHQSYRTNTNLPDASALPGLTNGGNYNTSGLTYPGFNAIVLSTNEANSHYNGLQVDLNSQVGRDLYLRAFYTLSRAIDSAADSRGPGGADLSQITNPYLGWRYDVGPSGFDRTHNAAVNFIYDIPLFRNNSSRLVKSTVGGWQISGIVTIESGVPVDIHMGGKQSNNGLPNVSNRPDLAGKISYPQTAVTCTPACFQQIQYIDPSAFAAPTIGSWGNLGHYAVRGPGRDNWNLSLFKSFTFSESRGSRLELRLETFNVWNHTQFNGVDNTVSFNYDPVTKLPTTRVSNTFGRFNSAFDPRILQLGGKVYF